MLLAFLFLQIENPFENRADDLKMGFTYIS
jgi:hypothetical protein